MTATEARVSEVNRIKEGEREVSVKRHERREREDSGVIRQIALIFRLTPSLSLSLSLSHSLTHSVAFDVITQYLCRLNPDSLTLFFPSHAGRQERDLHVAACIPA